MHIPGKNSFVPYRQFIESLGFQEDPFSYTNADQEEKLPDYFISPPYFPTVFGDPSKSQSFVVFAPRGGGKSAQRRMIEQQCKDNQVLPITYDHFEFSSDISGVADIKLFHHLRNVLRFALVGLLFTLDDKPGLRGNLSNYEKETLVKLATEHLSGINDHIIEKTLDSLRSYKDKIRHFWNDWLPTAAPFLQILLKRALDVDVSEFSEFSSQDFDRSPYLKNQLKMIIQLAQKLEYKSIYVLIDRVDEAELTSGPGAKASIASFQLIEPVLRDLELLETDGIAFKFFLWDQLEPSYEQVARTDRIKKAVLEWNDEMLGDMWKKRLGVYSQGEISGLDDISKKSPPWTPDELVKIFANHSPRDMIRIGGRIIAEQQEINAKAGSIEARAIYTGLEKFCEERAVEITSGRTLPELKRIRQVDFTIPYLTTNIFRETQQATSRNRIMRWRNDGAITEVEKIDNPDPNQQRPIKLFAVTDIRIAKVMHPEMTVSDFLKSKFKRCPKCNTTVLRDWGEKDSSSRCHHCQYDLMSNQEDNLDEWRREAMAETSRRVYRKETIDLANDQSSFLDALFADEADE